MDKKIERLLGTFDDLKFDSLIFIFGIGDGEYLKHLKKLICIQNKVFIIEPNKNIFNKFKPLINYKNIFLLPFFNENIKEFTNILREEINCRNFVNLYVDSYNDYEETYLKKYEQFIELIDENYYRAMTFIATFKKFKKIFIENIVSSISVLNEANPLDYYFMNNEDIPAIIVSAGPSLDKNIKVMTKYKNRLKNFLIVAGNRTVKPLIKNGIKPDLIVAMDPQEITYTMLKDYMNLQVPLVFYEQSNGKLLKEYKGPKIYTTQGVLNNIEGLEHLNYCFSGGSVAHSSVDISILLGCSNIIFIGQDFAYTFNKHHAEIATLDIDKEQYENQVIVVEDVFGNKILSNKLLDFYKKNMEYYIEEYNNFTNKEFINCSYGAKIKGAEYKNLEEVLLEKRFNTEKKLVEEGGRVFIDTSLVLESIIKYIDSMLNKCDEAIETYDSILLRSKPFEVVVTEFDESLKIIDEFVKSSMSLYFSAYLEEFLFEIKEKYFRMLAKDYNLLSTDIIYQSEVFTKYFNELKLMLKEVKEIYLKCIENTIKK